ncbi:biotin synthase BioB [Maricaulis sp.]|uniref:biotin synthase BioB n=1 Tax=Maricaulis sp. TaxID=1486257 RepID=UPI0025BCD173|nr:biotin synthase BioB [Maricaulis sp.]
MSLLNDIDQLTQVRTDWTRESAGEIYRAPFNDLIFAAQSVHRRCHPANQVQTSQLLSIKTGGCAEDCGYCNQSAHFDTGLAASKLMPLDDVMSAAKKAKDGGATRFCMGAAWRELKPRDEDKVCAMIEGVKSLGMETCVTLGMLGDGQAERLRDAGLDYYNHNLDTAPEDYGRVISTRTYQDRLDTLSRVRGAGIHVCTGGIVGMGEDEAARIGLLTELASMDPHPESVPINHLVAVPDTPLGDSKPLDGIDFVRTIATARILMPRSMVRLSAGREGMSRELQALCFLAGANSIFVGEELLTTPNPERHEDFDLFKALGIEPMTLGATGSVPAE